MEVDGVDVPPFLHTRIIYPSSGMNVLCGRSLLYAAIHPR
jgi:hypothetical protein